MKAKNTFLKLVAIAFLGAFSLKAEIPVTQIRGLASVLKPDKQNFSPVWGAVLWNSPYIENLYRFGLPTSNTVRLARSIFFVHHDDVTFDTTYLATRIATYFTPYLIGQLVGLIDNFYNTPVNPEIAEIQKELDAKKEELKQKTIELRAKGLSKKKLKSELFQQNPGLFTQITNLNSQLKSFKDAQNPIAKFKEELESCVTAIEVENQDKIQKKIKIYYEEKYIPKLESDLAELRKNLASELEKTTDDDELKVQQQKEGQLQKDIKQKEEQLPKARKNQDLGIKNSTYKEYKKNFLDHLCKSLEETDIFIPNNTIFLFLSSLWKKTNTKDDFLQYFKGLYDKYNDKEELFNNPQFIANGFSEETVEYSSEDFFTFEKASKEEVKEKYINDIEALAFLYLGYKLFGNHPLPSEVSMIGGVKYKEFSFPDCGSTALRNFFNAILYNPQTKEFDLEFLNGFTLNPKFKDFYTQKYKNTKKIRTNQAHDDWAFVTSGLPGVSYRKGGVCEINAGIKNMLKVIENLVGIKTFEELAEKFKANGIEVEMSYKHNVTDEKYDKNNEITFYINKPSSKNIEVVWKFSPGHFQIKFPETNNVSLSNYIDNLQNLTRLSHYNTEKQIIFLDIFSDEFNKSIEIIKNNINNDLFIPYVYFTILIQNMSTPERKIKLLEELIEHKIFHKNQKLYIEFARSVYTEISEDDYFNQIKYFEIFCKADLKIFDPTKKPFNKLTDMQKGNAIISFLRFNQDADLTKWTKDNILTIKDGEDKIYMIRAILENINITDSDLIKWAKDSILTIKFDDDFEKRDIIIIILNQHGQDANLMELAKETILTIKKDRNKRLITRAILDKPIQEISNLRQFLDIAKTAKTSFAESLEREPNKQEELNQRIQDRLDKKIQEIEAEIQKREAQEDASVTLGFLSKVKQFWNKLTFRKQNKTIIKTA